MEKVAPGQRHLIKYICGCDGRTEAMWVEDDPLEPCGVDLQVHPKVMQ
jgi:hypothetical protein